MSITCLSMVKQTIIYNEGKWVNWLSSEGTGGTKYLTVTFWWQVLTILLGRMYFFSANCVSCSKTSPLCEIKKLVLEHSLGSTKLVNIGGCPSLNPREPTKLMAPCHNSIQATATQVVQLFWVLQIHLCPIELL